MTKTIKLLIVLILLTTFAAAQTVVDTFYSSYHSNWSPDFYVLYSDQSYTYEYRQTGCTGHVMNGNVKGKYRIFDNNYLRLFPELSYHKTYQQNEGDTVKGYDNLNLTSDVKIFHLVEYNNSKFLFENKFEKRKGYGHGSSLLTIANKLNELDSSFIATSIGYYKNSPPARKFINKEVFDKSIKKNYPEIFKGHILDSPIIANIISIKEMARNNPYHRGNDKRQYVVSIDKGLNDGLLPEMILYPCSKELKDFRLRLKINIVTNSESIGIITEYQNIFETLPKCYSTKKPIYTK